MSTKKLAMALNVSFGDKWLGRFGPVELLWCLFTCTKMIQWGWLTDRSEEIFIVVTRVLFSAPVKQFPIE